jgi:hypothetical protein
MRFNKKMMLAVGASVSLLIVGATGAAGDTNDPGPIAPSHGYSTEFETYVPLEQTGTKHTLMSLTVPPGSYVVSARLQGTTVTDPDGALGNDYRYDCFLSTSTASLDSWVPRVGRTPHVESYLVYMGAFTGDGPITFSCKAGNGHPLIAQSGRMTAISVGGLN